MSSILTDCQMMAEIHDALKQDPSLGKMVYMELRSRDQTQATVGALCKLTVKVNGKYAKASFLPGSPIALKDFYVGKRAGPIFVFGSNKHETIEIAAMPSKYSSHVTFADVIQLGFISNMYKALQDIVSQKVEGKPLNPSRARSLQEKYQNNPLFGVF